MKNKKGFFQVALTAGLIYAVILAIVIFIAFASGGASAIWTAGGTLNKIVQALSKIPTWGWIIIGVFSLLLMLRRR